MSYRSAQHFRIAAGVSALVDLRVYGTVPLRKWRVNWFALVAAALVIRTWGRSIRHG